MRGSIRKRGESSWELKIELERINGKRHRRFVTVRGSYKEAQKELTRLLRAADDGTLPDPTRMTVGEYLLAWLDTTHAQSPKTLERYCELAQRQIIPHLGHVKLPKLRPENVEQWHSALLASGLSARTVRHAHRVLSLVLKRAVENGTLARNVAAVCKPPAVEADEVGILTPDQIAVVLDSLKGHSLFPIVSLALATGARRGELLALEWGDVDLDRGTLRVERSVEETRAGGLRVKPPKTRHGRRTITLPSETVAMMRAHKVQVLEVRLVLGLGNITAETLLFSNIEGKLLSPNNVTRGWHRACRARGLPAVSFHSLRHAHATALIRAGVDVLTVSRRLGHSKAHITLDTYGHLVEGADAAAAKAIEGILK